MDTKFTFSKKERLKSKKIIDRIFNREGKTFSIYPFRIIWLNTPLDSDSPAQISVSVPKRSFKKAVHRNKIRRKIKECWRLQKHEVYQLLREHDIQSAIMIVYTAKKELPYAELDSKMNDLLKKFSRKVIKGNPNHKES